MERQAPNNPLAQSFLLADEWKARIPIRQGSWQPEWQAWLAACSSPEAKPRPMGAPDQGLLSLAVAPGTYVL